MKSLFVFGTRPEAIKLAPVIKALKDDGRFDVKVCVTAQHRHMLDQVLQFFSIPVNYDLNVMMYDQSLFQVTARVVEGLEKVVQETQPDITLVQGDTTSAFVGALAAFYEQKQVAHVEAGLRTQNRYSPFPEEANRTLVGRLAHYHFAPTERAAENLRFEGIVQNTHVVGNTVIDALFEAREIIEQKCLVDCFLHEFKYLDGNKRLILVTGHRRESFGKPFENICRALHNIVDSYPDVEIIYPVHLNPNVRKPVFDILGDAPRVHLIEPVDYPRFVWLLDRSYIVLTDSGGIQEEAPSLGKPVLVMREVTERQEGIDGGTALLVGTDRKKIVSTASRLLDEEAMYDCMSRAHNPYGDGKSSQRILSILSR